MGAPKPSLVVMESKLPKQVGFSHFKEAEHE